MPTLSVSLSCGNFFCQIPSLNDIPLHNLKPNSLVRIRCMIQDMFDPEFYLGLYEVEDNKTGAKTMRSGKYKDVAECGVWDWASSLENLSSGFAIR